MEWALTYITLDVQKIDSGQLIKAKRGDSARRLVVSLTNRGRPYIPGEGVTAVFYERKPDGNPCFNACDIDGCTVTYDFTGQTTNVEGLAACEIRLYDAGGQLLTSPRFELLVDATEYQEGDVPDSSPEYTALTEMVAKGTELIRDLTDVQAGLEPIRDAAVEAAQKAEANANRAESAAQRTETDAQAAIRAAESAQKAKEAAEAAGIKTGEDAPSSATEGRVGSLYLQTGVTPNCLWVCIGADDGVYRWQQCNVYAELGLSDGGDGGVLLVPEGTETQPVLNLYGRYGDENVTLRGVAPAQRDTDAPNLRQVQELIGQGGGAGYVASDEPPEDTRALWVDTAEPPEAVALGVTAVETAKGVDLYCTDELGTTTVTLWHGKDGANSGENVATDEQVLAAIDARMPEIIDGVLEKLPIVGVVDDANIITLYGGLQAGTYTLKYEHDDGSTSDIGSLTVTAPTPDKELTGITATYNGGDVAVGTAFSSIGGIVVTAQYDDGSTANITGYTITPGVIVEGENVVTVTYGGYTASIAVVGVSAEVSDSVVPPFTEWTINESDNVTYSNVTAQSFVSTWAATAVGTVGSMMLDIDNIEVGRRIAVDIDMTTSTGVTTGIGFNIGNDSVTSNQYASYAASHVEFTPSSNRLVIQFKVSNSKYTGGFPVTVEVRNFRVYFADEEA